MTKAETVWVTRRGDLIVVKFAEEWHHELFEIIGYECLGEL